VSKQSWGGMKEFQKDLSMPKKITNIMMLKTKRRKSQTLGGTIDHFANPFQGLEMHGPKKSLGYKH